MGKIGVILWGLNFRGIFREIWEIILSYLIKKVRFAHRNIRSDDRMHQLKWVGEAGERSEPIITKCYSCKICSTIVESCGFVKYSCTTVVTYKKYKIYSCTTKFTVVTYKSFRFRPFFFLRRYLGTLGKNAIRAKK